MPDEMRETAGNALAVAVITIAAFFLCGPKMIHAIIAAARAMGAN